MPRHTEPNPDEWITLAQASEYRGLGHVFLRQLALKKRLKARKLGSVWVTTLRDVDKYLASRTQTGRYREDLGD